MVANAERVFRSISRDDSEVLVTLARQARRSTVNSEMA
jgi:hypothetical protein